MSQQPTTTGLKLRIPARKAKTSDTDKGAPQPSCPTRVNENMPLVVEKAFCNFCADILGETFQECVGCKAYVCEQARKYGAGCIALGTVKPGIPFRCLPCDQRGWNRQGDKSKETMHGLPYEFVGYGGRKRAKLTWPLVVITICAATKDQAFLEQALTIDLKNHYLSHPENLCLIQAVLRPGGQAMAQQQMEAGINFVRRSVVSGVPANTFVVIETSTDLLHGRLRWSSEPSCKEGSLPQDLLDEFFGRQLNAHMSEAAEAARSAEEKSPTTWYDASPYSRGGWRGLFVVAGGFATRSRQTSDSLRQLVQDDRFDLVVGFGATSLRVDQVKDAISQLIERIAVDKTADIWPTVMHCIGNDAILLDATPVVVIFRARGSQEVLSRKIGLHFLPYRPWGTEFRACGREGYKQTHLDFFVKGDAANVRMECKGCGWKSAWVKQEHTKGLLFRLNSKLPNAYWHEFPPPEELRMLFVNVTKQSEAGRVARGEENTA